MNLLTGLYLYEKVLLYLGIFLFIILAFALIYLIVKKEEIKKLLFFFPISIIMIGFPSIQEITISREKISLKKYIAVLQENPNDSVAAIKVKELSEKLENRATSVDDIITLSKAKLLIGDSKSSIELADKAMAEAIDDSNFTNEETVKLDSIKTVNPNMNKAYQIKELAKIQNLKVNTDTALIEDKIKELKLDRDLINTAELIKADAIKRETRQAKEISR